MFPTFRLKAENMENFGTNHRKTDEKISVSFKKHLAFPIKVLYNKSK